MRSVKVESDYEDLDERCRTADFGEHVNEVLNSVDEQLKEFGLEVVMVDEGESSWYVWRIEKREPT